MKNLLKNLLKILLKIIKTIFLILWFLILLFEHLEIVSAYEYKNGEQFFWIISVLIWWIITVAVYIIFDKIKTKRKEKVYKNYQKQYISEITIDDNFFGKMCFDYNLKENTLESKDITLPPLGVSSLYSLYISDYCKENSTEIFENLRVIYEQKNIIFEEILLTLLETCNEYEETDNQGNAFTLEKLKEISFVSDISIHTNNKQYIISLEISSKGNSYFELGGHGFITYIELENLKINKMDFSLEG